MLKQKSLRLSVRPIPGESVNEFRFRSGNLKFQLQKEPARVAPGKLLCDLLKREARLAMGDVTHCEPAALPGQPPTPIRSNAVWHSRGTSALRSTSKTS